MKAETNIRDDLNKVIQQYQRVSGKTATQVLEKQSGKLGFLIFQELRSIAPEKGSIRAELKARLASGMGIKVSKTARKWADKKTQATASTLDGSGALFKQVRTTKKGALRVGKTWWEVAVNREIAVRESARGFLAVSARYPRTLKQASTYAAKSKFGPVLSKAAVEISEKGGHAKFVWPGGGELPKDTLEGIQTPKAQAAIDKAVALLREDILDYIRPRLLADTENALVTMKQKGKK